MNGMRRLILEIHIQLLSLDEVKFSCFYICFLQINVTCTAIRFFDIALCLDLQQQWGFGCYYYC